MLDRSYYLKKQHVPFWFLYMTLPSGCLLKLGFLSVVLRPSCLMHTTCSHLISTLCFLSGSIFVFSTSTWKSQLFFRLSHGSCIFLLCGEHVTQISMWRHSHYSFSTRDLCGRNLSLLPVNSNSGMASRFRLRSEIWLVSKSCIEKDSEVQWETLSWLLGTFVKRGKKRSWCCH